MTIIPSVKNTFNVQVEGEDVIETVDTTAAKKDKKSKYQKVKSSGPFILRICFAASIIVMIFVTPTIFFDRLFKLDYGYCKQGTYEFNITAKDKTCEGWSEFRYLNLIKYFPIRYNIH